MEAMSDVMNEEEITQFAIQEAKKLGISIPALSKLNLLPT